MRKIINYILALSPVLVSSLFIYKTLFPAWANSLFLATTIILAIAVMNVVNLYKKRETHTLTALLYGVGIGAAAVFSALYSGKFLFGLMGKGVVQWTGISVLALFVLLAHFLFFKSKKNIALIVSAVVVCYSVANIIIFRYFPSISEYTGYLNIPMVSSQTILNYSLAFSLVVLVASLIKLILDKKSMLPGSVNYNKWLMGLYILVPALILVSIGSQALRYVAAYNYGKASDYFTAGDIEASKRSMGKAISIYPFDTYYTSRMEITGQEISNLLNSSSSDKDATEKRYKELVDYQVADALKAVEYDDQNSFNYIALGLAYEASMLLTKEEGYAKALEAYEKARALSDRKDYIDVAKAKLAFSSSKEEEGLSMLDRAINYNPSSTPALYLSSQYYASKNKLESAIEYGEKAKSVSPDSTDISKHLGLLYLQAKDYEKSVQNFLQAFALSNASDNMSLYYIALGYKELADMDNFKIALEELEKRVGSELPEIVELKRSVAVGPQKPEEESDKNQ